MSMHDRAMRSVSQVELHTPTPWGWCALTLIIGIGFISAAVALFVRGCKRGNNVDVASPRQVFGRPPSRRTPQPKNERPVLFVTFSDVCCRAAALLVFPSCPVPGRTWRCSRTGQNTYHWHRNRRTTEESCWLHCTQ